MRKFLEYTLFFIILLVVQVMLLDNLNLSMYISPLAYVAFLVLLPLGTPHGLLVIIGFAAGVVLDFFLGTGGLHAIASTFTAFVRPGIMNLTLGRDFARDSSGVFTRREMLTPKWIRYTAVLTILHCAVYFLFEALTWKYFGLTLLKIVLSSVVTALIAIFIGAYYPVKR